MDLCSFASIRSALHHVLDLEPCTVIHIPPSVWIIVLYTHYCIEYICRLYMFALPCTSCMLFHISVGSVIYGVHTFQMLLPYVSTYLGIPPEIVGVVSAVIENVLLSIA